MPRRKRDARRATPGGDPWDAPTAPWNDLDDDEVWGQQAVPAAVLANLDAAQAARLARVLTRFDAQTQARGERYAATGRVLRLAPTDVGFVATVQDSEPYEAVWAWFDDAWASDCDCPVATDCRHAYAAARVVLAGRVAPAPDRERPDLGAGLAASPREELVGELVRWAERRRATPSRSLRLVCSLERSAGEAVVGIEARLTSTRLADAPRTAQQLQQLRNELMRTPDVLTANEAAALRLLTDGTQGSARMGMQQAHRTYLGGRALAALARRLAGTPIASWGDDLDAELAARAGVVAGAPLRVSDAEARLLPVCVPRGDATAVELVYVWPDGTQRPLAAALRLTFELPCSTPHEPPMVLAEGLLSPLGDAPPAPIVERFAAAGGVLVAGEERARLVGTLAAAFPHLRPTLAAHTRAYDAQPLIALDLRADDWLQIRLLAHPRRAPWTPGAPLDSGHEYVPPGRWRRPDAAPPAAPDAAAPDRALGLLGEAPAAAVAPAAAPADAAPADDIWIEAPNADDVAPAIAWLAALPARAGGGGRVGGHAPTAADREVGWWLRAAPRAMEALAAAWATRPTGVTYAGNRRMQRLLHGDEA